MHTHENRRRPLWLSACGARGLRGETYLRTRWRTAALFRSFGDSRGYARRDRNATAPTKNAM